MMIFFRPDILKWDCCLIMFGYMFRSFKHTGTMILLRLFYEAEDSLRSFLRLCIAARWILDLLRVLQQPLGRLYGAEQIDERWQVPALLRGLSPAPANDRHRYRWLPAHPCPENLQISTPVG